MHLSKVVPTSSLSTCNRTAPPCALPQRWTGQHSHHCYLAHPPAAAVSWNQHHVHLKLARRCTLPLHDQCRRKTSLNSTSSGSSGISGSGGSRGAQPAAYAPPTGSFEAAAAGFAAKMTSLFPLWVIVAALLGLLHPPTLLPLSPYLTSGLALTMLGMGLTMRVSEFTSVVRTMPQLLLLGLAMQFTVMPALGWFFSRCVGLPEPFAVGMALLSACPGGTASNIVCFIARGEMGLSILMTTASTLAAVVATPAITVALAGTLVPVDGMALLVSTLQVVLLPVVFGALINQSFPESVARVAQFTPCAATLIVAAVVGATLAGSAGSVLTAGAPLLAAVVSLHASGFAVGYLISKLLGLSEKIARTNSIEVGMQNATLGAVLATLHFADPRVAAPCAIAACIHSTMGSMLAAFWRSRDDAQMKLSAA